jgi:hypothetical protein
MKERLRASKLGIIQLFRAVKITVYVVDHSYRILLLIYFLLSPLKRVMC